MSDPASVQHLLATLEDATNLIKDYAVEASDGPVRSEPLPSLLEQCQALVHVDPQPLRSVHQFACTGGTLISKLLAAMPNVTMLSEIDPLSPSNLILGSPKAGPRFQPTDVLYGARFAARPIDDDTVAAVFTASVETLHREIGNRGGALVLRDHAHSQFCSDADWAARPTVRELLQRISVVKSVITVRHPLDSFLSLDKNGWRHFVPFAIDTYATRYEAFLDRHMGVPIFKYEDFVANTDETLAKICDALALPFVDGTEQLLPIMRMSGDSGRSSNRISYRPRRDVPRAILQQAKQSDAFKRLCETLGYPPSIDMAA